MGNSTSSRTGSRITRKGFFVSSYTRYTARRDRELMRTLRQKGITSSEDMSRPLRPGSVLFTETATGITHRDYVTRPDPESPQGSAGEDVGAAVRVASRMPASASR